VIASGRLARTRGFTLFEIIAAMAIFLVGIVGILSLLTAAAAMQKEAVDLSTAGMIADELVASVRAELSRGAERDPSTGRVKPWPERPVPGHDGYFYDVRFAEDPVSEDTPLKVEVRVFWKSAQKKRGTSFASFVVPKPEFSQEAAGSLKQLRQ
jgi:prepilin-type N-terminal cleavage/methylation domain-containing protein